jgi:hypothetical protein
MVEAFNVGLQAYLFNFNSTSTRLDVAATALKHLIRVIQEQGHKNEEKGKEAHGARQTRVIQSLSASSR